MYFHKIYLANDKSGTSVCTLKIIPKSNYYFICIRMNRNEKFKIKHQINFIRISQKNLPEICVILCFSRRESGRVGSESPWVGSGQDFLSDPRVGSGRVRCSVGRVGSEKSDPRPTLIWRHEAHSKINGGGYNKLLCAKTNISQFLSWRLKRCLNLLSLKLQPHFLQDFNLFLL